MDESICYIIEDSCNEQITEMWGGYDNGIYGEWRVISGAI